MIDLAGLFGTYFPFHEDRGRAARRRRSAAVARERYGTQAGYVAAVTSAANELVAQRFMLRADADAAIAAAVANPILP